MEGSQDKEVLPLLISPPARIAEESKERIKRKGRPYAVHPLAAGKPLVEDSWKRRSLEVPKEREI